MRSHSARYIAAGCRLSAAATRVTGSSLRRGVAFASCVPASRTCRLRRASRLGDPPRLDSEIAVGEDHGFPCMCVLCLPVNHSPVTAERRNVPTLPRLSTYTSTFHECVPRIGS